MEKLKKAVKLMDKSITYLSLELPETVQRDIGQNWKAVKDAMTELTELKMGPYTIKQHPPIPDTAQVNIIWIEKDEGMSVDLDNLWEKTH